MKKTLFISLFLFQTFLAFTDTVNDYAKAREVGQLKSQLLVSSDESYQFKGELKANLDEFNHNIQPILKKNCISCHGPKKAKGKFRIDTLNPDLLIGSDAAFWLEVYDVLSNDEMPPEDEPDFHLNDSDRKTFVNWLGEEMKKATIAQRNQKKQSSFRRMARYEYNYALQDLLGLTHDFSKDLAPEAISKDGFKNSSELLTMSAQQLEKYSNTAIKAMKQAVVLGDQPKPVLYQITMDDLMKNDKQENKKKLKNGINYFDTNHQYYQDLRKQTHMIDTKTGKGRTFHFSLLKAARAGMTCQPNQTKNETPLPLTTKAVIPQSKKWYLNLGNHLPDEGMMRVRIRIGRKNFIENEYGTLSVSLGAQISNHSHFAALITKEDLVVRADADNPEFIEFFVSLSEIPRNMFRKNKKGNENQNEVLIISNTSLTGQRDGDRAPELHIDYIEIEAPYYKSWPTQAYRSIFVESSNKNDELKYAEEILENFMKKAFRRPISKAEIKPYLSIFSEFQSDFKNFEETILYVLAMTLASPDFLYISQKSHQNDKPLDAYELASRLSFFLWSSIPDDELLHLAKTNKLLENNVLDQQIKRMLADEKSQRFSKNFVEQWLGLAALNEVQLDHKIDDVNEEALAKNESINDIFYEIINLQEMIDEMNRVFRSHAAKEPIAFFKETISKNNSIMDLLYSDYLVINEYLAKHYGIEGVHGPHFRPVAIKPNSERGGILTTASVMAINADGKNSNPLKRGIWLLEHILNDPPPPPPANVPEVDLADPKILEMTLKERLKDHRSKPACISCHSKIDPWGIAFENFDASGKFRENIKGKPVDATSTLFNQKKLDGYKGVKQYLLMDRQDQFSMALVHKMLSYALGRRLSFSDRSDIEKIAIQSRKQDDRLADLISLIIKSEIFQSI